nr:hypothetical protein [Tanacetum cinerariifolium]
AAALAASAAMGVPAVGVCGGQAVVAVMEAAGLWCGGRKLPASGCSYYGGWLGGSGGGCRRAAAVDDSGGDSGGGREVLPSGLKGWRGHVMRLEALAGKTCIVATVGLNLGRR